jgi:flagellar biosynthesis protein FlhA
MQRISKHRGLLVPVGFVLMLVVILVPLPPFILDVMICVNIALAVIILMTTIYMRRALDFSVFPSLLLGTTMLRLVLNVASTRLILTAEASSPEEAMNVAGHVISAFGSFVAGDSLFVGIIIFLILTIVQFMVVTKGAGRIAEVAARFTLDAMPGKQMAIDAELSQGMITEDVAREKRDEVAREADFYGAMDGASKFVKGDASAGIIITAINIIGGFCVGVIARGWDAGQTAEVFTKLTIGDGLTSQLPSLIISLAAALIVTRSGAKQDLGDEATGQLLSQPRGLVVTASFLVLLAFTPLPTIPLMTTAAGLGAIAFAMRRIARNKAASAQASADAAASAAPEAPPVEQILKVDLLELEVGYGLVGLVDAGQGGDLLDRISAVRRQLAAELGLVMPPVRIRDNVQLGPNDYRVKIRGAPVAPGRVNPDRLLAMNSGLASVPLDGEKTTEPAFGLDAWWITPNQRARAETLNYTVVDPSSVIATHLTEVVKKHADELLTRTEVNNLIEGVKERAPKLVEDTIPALVKPAALQKILQNLLRERVPVRDLETILEALADWAPKTDDLDVLTEYVRNALRRTICQNHVTLEPGGKPKIVCVTLDPALEDHIGSFVDRGPGGTTINMPARVAQEITRVIAEPLAKVTAAGYPPVVIASPQVRAIVHQIVSPTIPAVAVLGYNEIVHGVDVQAMGLASMPTRPEPAPAKPRAAAAGAV